MILRDGRTNLAMSDPDKGSDYSQSFSHFSEKSERSEHSDISSESHRVVVKIAVLGDEGTGKTSLLARYVESRFPRDYLQTLGVTSMEKSVHFKDAMITFSIWDLGGHTNYSSLRPLVCNDACVIFYVFGELFHLLVLITCPSI